MTDTMEEYNDIKGLFDKRIAGGCSMNDLRELLTYANDIMLSSSAFCAVMAYVAEKVPAVANEARALRKGCLDANRPQVGRRVCLRQAADRYPHFVVPEGAKGTIATVAEDCSVISVKMDLPIEGCGVWENCLMFNDHDTTKPETSAFGDFTDTCDVLPVLKEQAGAA